MELPARYFWRVNQLVLALVSAECVEALMDRTSEAASSRNKRLQASEVSHTRGRKDLPSKRLRQ